jgi:polyhydroxybutyrate depolymerase
MLHGAGATAAFAEEQTGWAARGRADGFAVVLPEGTPRDATTAPAFRLNPQLWNDGSGRGHVARRGVDDVGFIAALVERLVGKASRLLPGPDAILEFFRTRARPS